LRTGVKIVLAIVVLIVVGIGITLLSGGLTILMAPFQGEVEKSQQVEGSGEYRVAQHDYFYNLCSDIQAKQQNLEVLRAAGEKDAVVANEMQLNEMVSEYNANASNEYTKGQFKADELPYQIDAEKEVASCGSPS
jgi:hypothetical protein